MVIKSKVRIESFGWFWEEESKRCEAFGMVGRQHMGARRTSLALFLGMFLDLLDGISVSSAGDVV